MKAPRTVRQRYELQPERRMPERRMPEQKPRYISMADYLARNKKEYKKTPARTQVRTKAKTPGKTIEKKNRFF